MTKKDKLWVFDTQQYLEIYAPTIEDAEEEKYRHEKETGMDFTLVYDWEMYQDDHEKELAKCLEKESKNNE